jgi:hypothetical protein
MKVINLLFGLNGTCGFMLDSEEMTDIQSSFDDLIQEPFERDGCMVIYKGINLVLQAGEKYFPGRESPGNGSTQKHVLDELAECSCSKY